MVSQNAIRRQREFWSLCCDLKDLDPESISFAFPDTTASPSLNNNNVNISNSKSEPFQPIDTEGRECADSRKTEVVASRFAPPEVPVVRDCGYSAEKRKWSQMNAHKLLNQLASGGDSSSSDDEVKEFCCTKKPVSLAACSSPPGKVTILSKHGSAFTSRPVRPTDGGHARKKHRVIFADCDPDRPSLDFEKMQVSHCLVSSGSGAGLDVHSYLSSIAFQKGKFFKGQVTLFSPSTYFRIFSSRKLNVSRSLFLCMERLCSGC